MHGESDSSILKPTVGCLLGALLLSVLPTSVTDRLRELVRVGLQPGQRVALTLVDTVSDTRKRLIASKSGENAELVDSLKLLLARSELERRRAELAASELDRRLSELTRQGVSPFSVTTRQSRLGLDAVEARVLGSEVLSAWKSGRLLDKGKDDLLGENQIAVDGDFPMIDVGAEESVADGFAAFAGRCVVGRLTNVGNQTSSLELITDPGFRARAVIGRSFKGRLKFGPEGLLEGSDSDVCRLSRISADADVRTGDGVYMQNDSVPGVQMIFGRVVSVATRPGALHADITVRPEAQLESLRVVQIPVPTMKREQLARQD